MSSGPWHGQHVQPRDVSAVKQGMEGTNFRGLAREGVLVRVGDTGGMGHLAQQWQEVGSPPASVASEWDPQPITSPAHAKDVAKRLATFVPTVLWESVMNARWMQHTVDSWSRAARRWGEARPGSSAADRT